MFLRHRRDRGRRWEKGSLLACNLNTFYVHAIISFSVCYFSSWEPHGLYCCYIALYIISIASSYQTLQSFCFSSSEPALLWGESGKGLYDCQPKLCQPSSQTDGRSQIDLWLKLNKWHLQEKRKKGWWVRCLGWVYWMCHCKAKRYNRSGREKNGQCASNEYWYLQKFFNI